MSAISPKTIVITAYPGKYGSITMPQQTTEFNMLGSVDTFDIDSGGPKKRRRLTHLSPDEKLLRRKLKNRVAAQTARDRKKALMSDLEEKVAELEEENKLLIKQNYALRQASESLVNENQELKSRLSGEIVPEVKTESESSRSAAPAIPLQKEQVQILSRLMVQYFTFVVTLSLVFSGSSKILQTAANAVGRKRKQAHPLRRMISTKSELDRQTPHHEWWGSHQQSWNPSMN